jgi:hypothetical protein
MTETRFFGFICHLPMPQQRCAEGLKTWFLWVLLHLFQYLPNSSQNPAARQLRLVSFSLNFCIAMT